MSDPAAWLIQYKFGDIVISSVTTTQDIAIEWFAEARQKDPQAKVIPLYRKVGSQCA